MDRGLFVPYIDDAFIGRNKPILESRVENLSTHVYSYTGAYK